MIGQFPTQVITEGLFVHICFQEMYDILETVHNSDYYTSNPEEACLFLPSVDLLNIKNVDKQLVSAVLNSLPHWNSGRNHLILNIIGNNKRLPTDLAIVASPVHNNQRLGFDITIPGWMSEK